MQNEFLPLYCSQALVQGRLFDSFYLYHAIPFPIYTRNDFRKLVRKTVPLIRKQTEIN